MPETAEATPTSTAQGATATLDAPAASSPSSIPSAPPATQPKTQDQIDTEALARIDAQDVQSSQATEPNKDPQRTRLANGKFAQKKDGTTEPAPESTTQTAPKDDEGADALTPFTSDEQALMKRYKLDPESPTLQGFQGEERAGFLKNLRDRAQYADDRGQEAATLRRENEQLKQQLATRQQTGKQPEGQQATPGEGTPQQTAAAPDLDKTWSTIGDSLYTDDGPKNLRSAVEATVQHALKSHKPEATDDSSSLASAALDMLADLHFEQGFDGWTAPEGVDKNDDAVRDRVRAEAELIYQVERQKQGEKFNPKKFNLRHATVKAAGLLFNQQQSTADAQQRGQQARQARRGSPESGNRAPTDRPPANQAERDAQWFSKNPE